MNDDDISVILPAHQEGARIGACLAALRDQTDLPTGNRQLVIVANACTDDTVALARAAVPGLEQAGWRVVVIDTPEGGKIGALNRGDAAATGGMRLYLDADVVVDPRMIGALHRALSGPGARYAGARLVVPVPRSRLSAHYARFWQRLPFVAQGVTGAGLFAVNAAGRARWGAFPDVIGDDAFARLNFAPEERIRVDLPYAWPITEGLGPLVRVRRRQDAGTAQLAERFPELHRHAQGDRPGLGRLLRIGMRDPVGFAVYAGVTLAVRSRKPSRSWDRGR